MNLHLNNEFELTEEQLKTFEMKRKELFYFITHDRVSEKEWRIIFGSNQKKHKGTYYLYVQWIDEISEEKANSFSLSFSKVFSNEDDKEDQKLSSMLDEIQQHVFDGDSLGVVLGLMAGFIKKLPNDKLEIVPVSERKPFSYVYDTSTSSLDSFSEDIQKNINRTMEMDTKRFFKQNGWDLSSFEDEDSLGLELFEVWRENSGERDSLWTRSSECQYELFSPFHILMSKHLVKHAKEQFKKKGKEWTLDEHTKADMRKLITPF